MYEEHITNVTAINFTRDIKIPCKIKKAVAYEISDSNEILSDPTEFKITVKGTRVLVFDFFDSILITQIQKKNPVVFVFRFTMEYEGKDFIVNYFPFRVTAEKHLKGSGGGAAHPQARKLYDKYNIDTVYSISLTDEHTAKRMERARWGEESF